jgi:hypothetical protein
MYTIYHIEGVKIGCSKNPKKRVKGQGYSAFQVLEVHDDIEVASKREIELQLEYGYGRDCAVPYTKSATFATFESCSKAGKIGGKIGGKISGKMAADRGQLSRMGQIGGKIGGKLTGSINGKKSCAVERTCPYCFKTVRGPSYFMRHGPRCKLAPVTT